MEPVSSEREMHVHTITLDLHQLVFLESQICLAFQNKRLGSLDNKHFSVNALTLSVELMNQSWSYIGSGVTVLI